jgi:hypothetical protein
MKMSTCCATQEHESDRNKHETAAASVTSAESGYLIAVVKYMKRAGRYVPHLVMFPRKNMQIELTDGTPPESISVWMNPDCHFVK